MSRNVSVRNIASRAGIAAAIALLTLLALVAGLAGCSALGGGSGDRVHVDANTVRQQIKQQGGIGRR